MDKEIFYGMNETSTTLYNTTVIYVHQYSNYNSSTVSIKSENGESDGTINNYWALLAGLLVIGTAAGNILGTIILYYVVHVFYY